MAYSDPFGTGLARPYLAVHLVGPSGASGDVLGVVDSGADTTCLPLDFATLMGYTAADLRQELMTQAGGTMNGYIATSPSTAWVVGLEDRPFEIRPTFLDGAASVLWGRGDVFSQFGFAFDEADQHFSVIVPD